MAHAAAVAEPKVHMGIPLPNAKLAMWIFLVTEIMFFTALIGNYIIQRNGPPARIDPVSRNVISPWPAPHEVHLEEWMGAVNTFVLICSSLTVVLAHWSLHLGRTGKATAYIGATLALGCVFLGIKFVEYKAKWDHGILPGQVVEVSKLNSASARVHYVARVEKELKEIAEGYQPTTPEQTAALQECQSLARDLPTLEPRKINEPHRRVEERQVRRSAELGRGGEEHHRDS